MDEQQSRAGGDPETVPADLHREVEQMPDGRRITYYARGTAG